MHLPKLIQATRQQLSVPAGSAPAAAPAVAAKKTLDFQIAPQEQTQWCWAAVSTSVSHYYDAASTWTQCTVANAELGFSDCCGAGGSGQCNEPWYLDRALTRTGNLRSFAFGASSFVDVRTEINGDAPLCCRIGWQGGGGHFVGIQGYDTRVIGGVPTEWLEIQDPWYGHSSLSYQDFTSAYQGTGSWTHSYFTQA